MIFKANGQHLSIYSSIIIFVIASLTGTFTFLSLSQQGQATILTDSTEEGELVISLSLGFVRAYSDFERQYAEGLLPNPALFRAHALELSELNTLTSDVVGFPGKAINKEPTDEEMLQQMALLRNSTLPEISTSVFIRNEQTIHRSIWPFFAVDETCVACHNTIQKLSGDNRWQVGDLMGAQFVEKNISSQLKSLKRQTLFTSSLVFLVILAAFFSILFVFRLISLTKKLKSHASIDELTGCINRREVYDRVAKLEPMVSGAMVMIDIDNFKKINDRYGHAAGDNVIRDLANILLTNLRKNDWVARVGGEEFLLWLPTISAHEATKLAEHLRLRAQESDCDYNKKNIDYTISIGLHMVSNASPAHFDEWVRGADKNLYQAKKTGRNCVVA